jgi:hypothetical protein
MTEAQAMLDVVAQVSKEELTQYSVSKTVVMQVGLSPEDCTLRFPGMVGTRKRLGVLEIGVSVKWNDQGVSRKGVVTKDNGNNTFDITTPSRKFSGVHSTELTFVNGQEVVGRSNLGVPQAGETRRWVIPSERVTEVR